MSLKHISRYELKCCSLAAYKKQQPVQPQFTQCKYQRLRHYFFIVAVIFSYPNYMAIETVKYLYTTHQQKGSFPGSPMIAALRSLGVSVHRDYTSTCASILKPQTGVEFRLRQKLRQLFREKGSLCEAHRNIRTFTINLHTEKVTHSWIKKLNLLSNSNSFIVSCDGITSVNQQWQNCISLSDLDPVPLNFTKLKQLFSAAVNYSFL